MQTKGLSCKLPLELHDRISEEIRQSGVTVSQFVEAVINEHYAKGASNMGRTRTMAFQVSEELFQQIKAYLIRYEQVYRRKLTQREFVIGLIECALEEAEDEFGALETVREDERTEEETESAVCGGEPLVSSEESEDGELPGETEDAAVEAADADMDESDELEENEAC